MCLSVNLNEVDRYKNLKELENKYIKTLEEDKTVYKILHCINNHLLAPYQNFLYEIGKKYHIEKLGTNIEEDDNDGNSYFCIHEGFHAYTSLVDGELMLRQGTWYLPHVIVECTYPKGSKYCEEDHGIMCVSDTIIINEIIE